MMNPKPRANHRRYIEVLRRLSPEERLMQTFELSAFTRALFEHGLRQRFPHLSEEEFQRKLHERLELCHNRNY
jgi:hypothetical protein